MNESLLTLFIDIVVRQRGLDRELRNTERRAAKTNDALEDIGKGAEKGSIRAQKAVKGIRDEINETRAAAAKDITVNVDVDDSRVLQLKATLSGINDETVNVDVDTGAATAKLTAFERQRAMASRDIETNVDVDTGGAIAQLAAFRVAATSVVGAVSAMDSGVSAGGVRLAAFGGIAATAAALFTPLIGALAAVGSMAAGAGLGLAAVGGPLVAVITRLQSYHESLDKVASAQSSASSAADSLASANASVESAERSRSQALGTLEQATEDLELAQRDLNYALEDEPLNQEAQEISLARARDNLESSTTAYNEAVKKYGANSEEARDAALDLREAENDLALQQNETERARKDGSTALQSAMSAEESAADGVKSAEDGVAEATRAVAAAQKQAAQAAQAYAEAQSKVNDEIVTLTPAQQRLYDVAIKTGEALNRAFTPAQNAVSRVATTILRDVTPAFDVLNNVAVAVIDGVARAWDGLVNKMQMPVQRQNTSALLGISPEVTESLTRSVTNLGLALINMLGRAAPFALQLSRYIQQITLNILKWSKSTAATTQIRAAIQSAIPVFKSLWNLVLQVGAALFKFGTVNAGAVARAIDMLTSGLTWAINAFTRLTQTLGPIVPLTAALAPVFLFLVMVVGQVAGAFFGLITAGVRIGMAFGTILSIMGGPLTIALIAVAVAAVLIYKNWSKIAPVLQRVAKALQPMLNAFKQAGQQIKPIVAAIGNGIRTGLTTAFKFLAGQLKQLVAAFKRAWPGIKQAVLPVVTSIANVLRKALGAAFKFAVQQAGVVVKWFKANWPLIQRTASTVFNAVKSVVTTVIRYIWNIIKTTIGGLVNFWRANWDTIRAILVSVWNIMKTVISTAIKNALAIIKLTMQLITGDWKGAWNTIKTILSTTWNAMKTIASESIKIMGNVLKLGWEAIKSVAGSVWGAIKEEIASNIDAIIGTINSFIEKIKSAVNAVLDIVGLPPLGEGGGKGKGGGGGGGQAPNSGASPDARPRNVRSFAEGGRVDARPGGMYRVAEAGEPEWVINPRSPNYEQHLQSAAAQGGYRVLRSGGRGGRQHRRAGRGGSGLFPPWRAYGAAALGPTMHTYIPEMQKFVDAAEAEFGVYTNTYSNHPPGFEQPYYRERSMDMWAPGGTRGTPLSPEMHAKTVPWTIDYLGNNLNWLISEGRMLTSAGWGPDTSGYSHYDHQHTTAFASGPSATGGGSGGNLKAILFEKAWERLAQPIIDSMLDPLTSQDFFAARVAGSAGHQVADGIHDWILGKLGSTGTEGTGGSGLSGTPAENRELGRKMFPDSGLAGSFSSVDAIWTQESGWDETAQNPTSTAFGIPQFLASTWEQYGGVSKDAEGQIRKGYAYIGDRYSGSADQALAFKQANGWYEGGGLITRQHQAIVDPGELYLPLDSRQVQRSAQVALGTAELRAENARNHRELIHRLGNVGLNNETIRQTANVARAATVGTLYSRDGLEAHSVNALRAERRDRMASV